MKQSITRSTVNQSSKMPPLKPKTPSGTYKPAPPPDPKPVKSPKLRPSQPGPPKQYNQQQIPVQPPGKSMIKKDSKALKPLEEDEDVYAESERLAREIEEEFGITVSDDELELPWLEKLDALKKELENNFIEMGYIDNGILSAIEEGQKDIELTNDVFDTVSRLSKAGFDKIHENIAVAERILDKRTEILGDIGLELARHGASDFTADLLPDDDLKDIKAPRQPPKMRPRMK